MIEKIFNDIIIVRFSSSEAMDNIRIIFVLANKYSKENEASKNMIEAYEACKQNNTNVSWVKESRFDDIVLSKSDFVVFEEFKGNCFEQLKTTKCARILGPWAVSVCLIEGKAIPNYPWPIYNVAMYNCVITSSHLSKSIKAEIKEKVEMMGGCYMDTLVAKSTHLITGSAKSEKYLAAAESGVKLMCQSWIDDVWQTSQLANVHGDDDRFSKHRCLPFHNLIVCTTGITSSERLKVEKLVKENGGIYSGKLNLLTTDILICAETSTNSEKYKYARQHTNIKCVKIQWLIDCVAKGYALPHTNYQIQKTSTSTPNKETDDDVNPEFSILSAIAGPNMSQRQIIEDTITTPWSPKNFGMGKRKASLQDYGELIEKLDIKKAKRAGQYLDGCSVYITGFNPEQTEKLNKIINLSGATRYNTYSDRVTHVIVGDSTFHEVKIIKNAGHDSILVTVNWLLDSIENEHPVQEEKYLLGNSDFEKSDCGSPLSKKGLSFLRSNKMVTENDVSSVINPLPLIDERSEADVVQQYLNPNSSTQEDTLAKLLKDNTNFTDKFLRPSNNARDPKSSEASTQESSVAVTQDESDTLIFDHLKFLILDFEEEEYEAIKEKIELSAGEIVPKSYKGVPDYVVVPVFSATQLRYTATEIVNNLFVYDCEKEQELIQEILYYHRPFQLTSGKPLQNCYITLSSYTGFERVFLHNLIEALGGVAQEQFARVTSEVKGVTASTHLVSSEASGKKYEAALKWGRPVVNKDWLLECAKTGQYVNEKNYLMGAAKESSYSLSKRFSDQNDVPNTSPITSVPCPGSSRILTPKNQVTTNSKVLENTELEQSVARQFSNYDISKSPPMTSTTGPGPSRILTPKNQVTPLYKKFLDSAEKPCSQVTPVNKIMQNFRENNFKINSSPNIQKEPKKYTVLEPWMLMKTPETPLGAFLTPNPSPRLRKQWEYWLQQFPDKPSPKSTDSTPLSEIKKKLWNKIGESSRVEQPNFDDCESDNEKNDENIEAEKKVDENPPGTPENQQLTNRLQKLQDMLTASGGGNRRQSRSSHSTLLAPAENSESDSQPCTVGWDYQDHRQIKIFSLSGIGDEETKLKMVKQIEELGGSVSDLSNYDPSCTHLLCSKPARNEKTLSCMAAGKWILHTSYLEESIEAGYFLNEEEYEYGNPKSSGKFHIPSDKESDLRMKRMHWWRKEIAKRGYGAFNDMRAIVVAQKKEPMIRVIEAGGGTVIDIKPPFEDTVHATHCLIEQKSVHSNEFSHYIPLAKQGVYLLNTIYISDYLHQPQKDIRDCILPFFTQYYARS